MFTITLTIECTFLLLQLQLHIGLSRQIATVFSVIFKQKKANIWFPSISQSLQRPAVRDILKCNAAVLDIAMSERHQSRQKNVKIARNTLPLIDVVNWTRNCSDWLLGLRQLPKSACFSQKVSQGTTPD